MLFPYNGFVGFNFGVDLRIGRYSCKLLGQVRNASFQMRHFSCDFLKVLRLCVFVVLVIVQVCVAPCLMGQVRQQESTQTSTEKKQPPLC